MRIDLLYDGINLNSGLLMYIETNIIEENIYHWNHGLKALDIYQNNPYRLLGLDCNADIAMANKSFDKMIKMINLGIGITTRFDDHIFKKIDRNVESLQTGLFEIQRYPYGIIWLSKPYLEGVETIIECHKKVFSSSYNISSFEYDEFLRLFYYTTLNDPFCKYVYHWIYLTRIINLIYLAEDYYWTKVINQRTKTLLKQPSITETRDYFLQNILNLIIRLVKETIKIKNKKNIINWYYTLVYSTIEDDKVEGLILEIKDVLDDMLEETNNELKLFFKEMIDDSKVFHGIDVIKEEKIIQELNSLKYFLDNVFKIISYESQKGKRVRKPLYDTFRLVANIYLREGHYKEFEILLNYAWTCVYDDITNEQLKRDESICNSLRK